MENKFFLHRIRKDGDTYNKGIEVHDSLDAAIQSFHSQMKLAYNNPSILIQPMFPVWSPMAKTKL